MSLGLLPSSARQPEQSAQRSGVASTRARVASVHYKWVALSNTTLGVLMATINSSVMLIALPDIFRGIGVNPLQPGNTGLLLWLLMGYLVVTGVLVVSFGRLGDMFDRVRMYNLGFALFAGFSILLSITWMHGTAAAWWLICMRIMQGVGRRDADGPVPSSLTHSRQASAVLPWGSTRSPASPARSSALCSAGCSAPSTGGSSSSSPCRSASSAQSGRT
jgi:MFS family permease